MAEEDFLIKLGLDPSGMTDGVRRAVNESLAEINRLQKAAGDENPDARVAQLPNAARESLYSVDKSSTSELNKQKQIQQKMVEQRAKLIALAQQEATVVARATGKTPSSDQLGKIRAGGESALAASLGLDKLTPAIKGQITKVINQINAQFAPLEALSGTALQNKFRQISNEILPTVGVQEKTRVRKATAIATETDRAGVDSAVKAEEKASERSAKAAESGARDTERSEKTQASARRRTEKALDREAKATERRAAEAEKVDRGPESRVNLTKAQVGRVQNIFGEESATLNSKGTAGVFKYNQADAPTLKGRVEGLLGSGDLSAVETRALNAILEQVNRDLAGMQKFSAAMEAENAKQLATTQTVAPQQSLIPDQRPAKDVNAETESRIKALQEEYIQTLKKKIILEKAGFESRNKLKQIDQQIEATTNQERLAALKALRAREISIQKSIGGANTGELTKVYDALQEITTEAWNLPAIDRSEKFMPNFPSRDIWNSQENTIRRKALEEARSEGNFGPTNRIEFTDEIEQDIARELSKQLFANKELTEAIETEVSIRRRAIANALVPDEVIPPKAGDLAVVPTQPRPVIDAVSDDRSAKRADNQRYATEVLRRAAEGTIGDVPIEMEQVSDTTRQIALAKEEELQDARELAAAAARYGAIIETELAQQAAVAQQTTATMENAIPVTPDMFRRKVTGDRTPTRENYAARRRMADNEEYRAVVEDYGPDIARQAKGYRDSEYDRAALQEVLDAATADFERKYVSGPRAQIGAGSERIDPKTGRRSSIASDPLRGLRKLVQDGLIGTLGGEWNFLRDDLQESFGRPGAPLTPGMKMFEDFSKKYNLSIDPGVLTGGTGLNDALSGDDMMADMEKLRNLQEQVRTSVLSQRPLADYAERIEQFLLEDQGERQLPITDLDEDAARINDARERAALASAPQTGFDDSEWRSVVGNAQRQMAEEWDTRVQTERDYTRSLQQRQEVAVPQQIPVETVTTKQDAIQERTLTDSSSFSEEERALIGALINKTNALERQTLVLTSNYDDFKSAEEALISALNRKARALGRQTSTMDTGDGIEVGPSGALRPQPALRDPEDIADRDAQKLRNQRAADWTRQATAVIEGDEDALKPAELAYFKALEQQSEAAQQAASETIQQVSLQQGVNDAYAGLQGSIEAMIRQNAAEMARAKQQFDAATLNNQRSRFNATPRTSDLNAYDALLAQSTASPTPAQMKAAQYRKPPTALGFMAGYEKLGAPDAYEYLNPEKDAQMRLDLAIEKLEKAYLEQASLYEIITSGLADEFTDLLAAQSALTQRIKGMTNSTIVGTPEFFQDYTQGGAEDKVARRQLSSGVEAAIAADPKLQQALLQADLELLGLKEQQAAQLAREIATNPKLLQEMVEGIIAREQQTAALERETMASTAAAAAVLESTTAKRQRRQQTEFDFLDTPEGEQFYINQGQLNERRKALREGQPEGGFGRFVGALGYKTQGASNPLGFFGGGALASLRYGLPSMLMYGAMGGVGNTFKEAEELQYNLARLEGQFESTFGDDLNASFDDVRANILGIAKDTGLAADEITNLQIQLTGAFGGQTIAGVGGLDLVQAQVESAAKLAQTVKLPLAEITDGLTAASLAFGASFERIGDVAVALEQESGVLARETVSFIGDIAPVAQEAGYELEEFAAIAAVAQQRSGRSGAALAESFGRVIPALTEQKDKLMELAAIEPALANDDFVDAIRASDPKAILDQIGQAYNNMSKEAQQATISLLGGRREAQAVIPAIANQPLIEEYTDAANKSAGTLEERFARVQQTLTNNLQRLGESLRHLGIELLEAGLTDVLESAIDLIRGLATGLGPVLNLIQGVNEAFGGWPVKILAAVAAMKIFRAFAIETQRDAATGAVINNIVGTNIGVPSLAFGNGRGFLDNLRGPALANPANAGRFGAPTASLFSNLGLVQGGKAAGQGLLQAVGGGSAAVGGGLVGAAAFALLYSQVEKEVNKEKEEIKKLQDNIREETSQIDLSDPSRLEARIAQLENQEESLRNSASVWNRFATALNLVQSRAETVAIEIARLEDPEITNFYDDLDPLLQDQLFDIAGPQLGRRTGEFQDAVRRRRELLGQSNIDKVKQLTPFAGGVSSIPGVGLLRQTRNQVEGIRGFREDEEDYFNEVANLAGVSRDEIDYAIVEAFLSSDPGDALDKLRDDPGSERVASQLKTIRENLKSQGLDDSSFARMFKEAQELQDDAAKAAEQQLIGDNLRSSYDLGLISLDEYQAKIAQSRERRRELLQKGEKTSADEAELLRLTQEEQEDAAALAQALIARQEKTNQIAQALGASEFKLQNDTVSQGISNLQNPNFTDSESRFTTALGIIEAQKQIDLDLALRSGDIAKVNELLANGSTIPAEAQQALYEFQTFEKDEWKNLADDLQAVMDSAIDVFNDSIPKVGNRNTLFTQFGDTAQEVAQSIFSEYFTMGKLSEETLSALQLDMDALISGLSEKGLTPEQRNEIAGSINGLIDLLRFVGLPEEMLLNFLAGGDFASKPKSEQESIRKELEHYMKESPFGEKSEQQARFNQQQAFGAIESNYAPGKLKANKDAVASAMYDLAIANEQLAYVQDPKNQSSQADINAALERQQEAENALRQAYADSASSMRELTATRMRIAGNLVGAIGQEIAAIDGQIQAARAASDWVAVNNLTGQRESKIDELRKQRLSDANSLSQLNAGLNNINGKIVEAALFNIQEAQNNLNAARTPEEINSAKLALAQAQDSLRRAQADTRNRDFDVWAALMEFEGNTVAAAITRVKQAEYQLSIAKPGDETAQAQMALMQAQTALRQAQAQERDAVYRLFGAEIAGQDPVAQAKVDLALAKEQLKYAKGTIEQANARVAVIEAQRALNEAMNDARYSVYNLRQAELQAMGDDVGAAQVAAELARQQLNDAIKAGAGVSAVNNARASFISADKAAKDAVFQDRMDEYKWLLDMGRISKSQYINYLEGLKSTLIPGTKQFKDLELSIKQLKDDVGGDLQANLPTSLRLPTLYEVRRFDQTPQMGGSGYGVGYQDNRQVSISVEINDASQDTAGIVVKTLEDALGTGRNGYGQRRF